MSGSFCPRWTPVWSRHAGREVTCRCGYRWPTQPLAEQAADWRQNYEWAVARMADLERAMAALRELAHDLSSNQGKLSAEATCKDSLKVRQEVAQEIPRLNRR